MGREVCLGCEYPAVVCVCNALKPTGFNTKIIILQHPSETAQAKNTARLVSLVASGTEIIVGENERDFDSVRARFEGDARCIVVFPSPESEAIAKLAAQRQVDTIILLDGTWRKAKKIWYSNAWLRSMTVCKLETPDSSAYRIRKGTEAGGVSTLEAAALALEALEDANTQPLHSVFDAMQKHWQRFSVS